MHLINPHALWFLPLVILLLLRARSRRRRSRRVVSNLSLWRETPPRDPARMAAHRLRRNWLVALQAAFMLAVIAAIARPAIMSLAPHVAFVLDTSASMGARDGSTSRMDLARGRARAVVDRLPRRTRVRIVAAKTTSVDLGEFAANDPALRRAIDETAPMAGFADLAAAVRAARTAGGASADIYVFSDRSESSVAGAGDVRWIRVGNPADNIAVTTLAARRLPLRVTDGQVLVEIRNYGSTARETTVEITQNGTVVAQQPARVMARAAGTIVAEVQGIGGVVSARVASADALDIDNERVTLVAPLASVRVGLETRGNFFLEKALAANPALAVDVGTRDDWSADVIVCDGCRDLPPGEAGVLMIPPSEGDSSNRAARLAVSLVDHPVAKFLDLSDGVATPVGRVADGEVIMRAGGVPVLVAYERSGRRILELGLDLTASTLPLTTAFPVLVANAIDWLAARDENTTEIVAGEPLRWILRDARFHAGVTVTGPDGRPLPFQLVGRQLTITATDAAGVYHVRSGDWVQPFVVNPATDSASDLAARDAEGTRGAVTANIAVPSVRSELASALLLLALVLLGLEWQYSCRRSAI